jgi:integrase
MRPRKHNPTLPTGVYRVGDRYLVQWCVNGRRCRELLPRGTRLNGAIRFRRGKLTDADRGLAVPGRVTFEGLVALLEQHHATSRLKASLKLKHLRLAFAGARADRIDRAALKRYVSDRQQAGGADGTIAIELAELRRMFALAVEDGLLAGGPSFRRLVTVDNTLDGYFSVAEVDRLLKLLPAAHRPPVEFAFLTGWRRANVFGLTWERVDFGRGELTIPGDRAKNGDPLITPFAHRSRLEGLLREQARRVADAPGAAVFPHQHGMRRSWARAVKRMDKWVTRRGDGQRVRARFHTLRHSFAQAMIDAGVDERTVAALGGWRSLAMVWRYGMKTDRAKRDALKAQAAHLAAERKAAKKEPEVIDLLQQGRRQRRTA